MLFSIIVPVYNAKPYLRDCIGSVFAQKEDWELLLVDDGSADGSGELLDTYAKRDGRLRAFHQENQGQFFARQKGIENAKGEYLLFLDSDDELSPDCLSCLAAELSREKWDMILFPAMVTEEGEKSGSRLIGWLGDEKKKLSDVFLKEKLLSGDDLNSLCLKAFRRELFEGDETDYSFCTGTLCGEDKIRLLCPVTRAEKLVYLPKVLYQYKRHKESVTRAVDLKNAERMLAEPMFFSLQTAMRQWNMDDPENRKQLAVYYLRNVLAVYYRLRRQCRAEERMTEFRSFPWKQYLRKTERAAFPRLSSKEKCKFLAAMWKL